MLAASGYKTKKELKGSIGKWFNFEETSIFGPEYDPNMQGTVVVGPSPYQRKWFEQVWLEKGVIIKVK